MSFFNQRFRAISFFLWSIGFCLFVFRANTQVTNAYFEHDAAVRIIDIDFTLSIPAYEFCEIKIEVLLDNGATYMINFTEPKLGKMNGGEKKVRWDYKLEEQYSEAVLFRIYYTKDKVTMVFDVHQKGSEVQHDVTLFWHQPKSGFVIVPDGTDRYTISVGAKSTQELSFSDFEVWVDGKKYGGYKTEIGTIKRPFSGEYIYTREVVFTEGTHRLYVSCKGEKSEPITVTYSAGKPSLHILTIGVEQTNLKYTVNDAEDFGDTLREACQGQAMKAAFPNYEITSLLGEEATASKIGVEVENLKNQFKQGFIKSNDLIMVFISSHGTMLGDEFFILDSDFMQTKSYKHSTYSMTQLHEDLDSMLCTKVIFFDACFSGGGKGERVPAINYERLYIMGSSRADEKSHEHESWMNGAFTEALLKGLMGEADGYGEGHSVKKDKIITLQEAYNYVSDLVPEIVFKIYQEPQHPTLSQNPPPNIPLIYLD